MGSGDIRQKRVGARIPGHVLSQKVGICRSRLSGIENGYIQPTKAVIAAIEVAIEDLRQARALVMQRAAEVGWPCDSI
jgi:hypothetical protein